MLAEYLEAGTRLHLAKPRAVCAARLSWRACKRFVAALAKAPLGEARRKYLAVGGAKYPCHQKKIIASSPRYSHPANIAALAKPARRP